MKKSKKIDAVFGQKPKNKVYFLDFFAEIHLYPELL